MQDAWRAYLELALGLTEASKKKARKVAKELVGKGGATASQVQSLVDDLMSTSRSNREELARLVRYEVDRALGAVGLATADEVSGLNGRVQTLERQLRETSTRAASAERAAEPGDTGATTAAKTTARPTAAKQTVAKKTVAKKTVAKKTAASKTTSARSTAARRAPAKKAAG
jgi:polyhydroxyalkanoate synthesis regulator phasin